MGFVLFLLLAVGCFFVIKSLLAGKAALANTRAAMAELNTLQEDAHLVPTWSTDVGQKAQFLTSTARFADKKEIPRSFSRSIIYDDSGTALLMHFATLLERRGSNFRHQQIAAGDLVVDLWGRVGPDHRVAYITEDLQTARQVWAGPSR